MAPQKTLVMSQQQPQQTIGQQQGDQQAAKQQGKAKKRKSKQPQTQPVINNHQANNNNINNNNNHQSERTEPKHQVDNDKKPLVNGTNGKENLAQNKLNADKQSTTPAVVPSERTTIKKQQQLQQSQQLAKEPIAETKRVVPELSIINSNPVINKHQQLANEEADDIDAGIELDGSSNSGSSVKDINEDQIKSNSVSPVMAQSNLVNEPCVVNAQPIAKVTSVDKESEANVCVSPSPAKKISTTKQQLAANQQVIDADEQLLQEKLQMKQMKSLQDNGNNQPLDNNSNQQSGDRSIQTKNDKAPPPLRRRFSSQSSQEAHDGSLCKVCEQHVYQMERMLAEKSVYHKKCFRCHQCKIQLRVDNYSSHEGQVYCKAHHRQIFQPQVKLDTEDDVDIVAKSTSQTVDDYLLHRGRLTDLSFSFLQQTREGIQKRQMIICENEPTELPKDVVRSDTKVDDGLEQLKLNLNNILEKFERKTSVDGDSQPSSAGVVIEKPSFNIKQTLMAFENRMSNGHQMDDRTERTTERPVVKKLTNLNGFFKNSIDTEAPPPAKPVPVERSGSLMMRLKKYESRIAGEQVDDDDDEDNSDEDENNNNKNKNVDSTSDLSQSEEDDGALSVSNRRAKLGKRARTPKRLTSIDLSSLKNQWENGDISKRRFNGGEDDDESELNSKAAGDNNGTSEKNEELCRIRQQLAQKKLSESGPVRNIYEKAIREAQLQKQASRRDSSDLSAASNSNSKTTEIQQLLLNSINGSSNSNGSSSINSQNTRMPNTPQQNKDHFQLNLSNRANKLKEKFELGLINNSSHDDSDNPSDSEETPALTKLEQIRQEKLEDLSVFTDGEIKAREARSLFQQIDRRISAASGNKQPAVATSRSLASIGASMRTKLTNQMNAANNAATAAAATPNPTSTIQQQSPEKQQPIRLTNNVRT